MSIVDRVERDPERAWVISFVALVAVFGGGSVAFPRVIYDSFVWQYFWGPVAADAHSAVCAVRSGGETTYLSALDACASAVGVVAYPGYTLVSEVGYIVILLLALTGVVLLLRRLQLGSDRRLVLALLPLVFFGGALRVVEDATDTGELLTYPLNTLVISPVIYVTVFVVALATLVAAVTAERRGLVSNARRALTATGTGVLLVTLAVLAVVAADDAFYPQVFTVVIVIATMSTLSVLAVLRRFFPSTTGGTGVLVAGVVVWAHAVDGAANVVGLDWMPALSAGVNLVPKHPVNRFVVEFTGSVLPSSVLAVTGDAWPFLVIKLVAAALVVAVFDARTFEESPRYTVLLLVAIVAVGLGPGTRDLLRATLGV
jgi:uncharacterized membrane protein